MVVIKDMAINRATVRDMVKAVAMDKEDMAVDTVNMIKVVMEHEQLITICHGIHLIVSMSMVFPVAPRNQTSQITFVAQALF